MRRLIGYYPSHNIDANHYVVVDGFHVRRKEPHTIDSDTRKALISHLDEKAPKYVRPFRDFAK
ncbi:hypothetical protein HYX00_03735 [Candidatus Woesearchaeota archaeon]|nr:hypothetical protein [Candidatus Woesearchaeota archaeon]